MRDMLGGLIPILMMSRKADFSVVLRVCSGINADLKILLYGLQISLCDCGPNPCTILAPRRRRSSALSAQRQHYDNVGLRC